MIKLMELALEEFFVGQGGLVFGDEGGRNGAAQGIFHDFVVLGGAQKDADGRALVRLSYIAVEGFEIEFHFAEMLGFEFFYFQIEGNKTLQPAVEEEQVEAEILAADLKEVFLADKTKIAAQFDQEAAEVGKERPLEISF